MLKPQDILVLLKLVALSGAPTSQRELARDLKLSPSELSSSLKRCAATRLYDPHRSIPRLQGLEEFVIHGLKYVWPAVRGPLTRGVATAYAAPPLSKIIIQPPTEWPPVWPSSIGNDRGYSIEPLYPSVVDACLMDERLYELLALTDALREGRPRESQLAVQELKKRFTNFHGAAGLGTNS